MCNTFFSLLKIFFYQISISLDHYNFLEYQVILSFSLKTEISFFVIFVLLKFLCLQFTPIKYIIIYYNIQWM